MKPDHVTFVVATYKRAEALRCTLLSLQSLYHQDWSAVVVGDCCGEETYEAVRSLSEPRIRYYNLPERFGEQSGPNSFGLSLVNGGYVTFLNQDDLLLKDHLDYALNQIAAHGADFFIGESAIATGIHSEENGAVVPLFSGVSPAIKDLNLLMSFEEYIFDPSSFWLIKTDYARAAGNWRPARELWRSPLRDWIMRAWRLGGKFRFGDRVTGLRFLTHYTRNVKPYYSGATPEIDYMAGRLKNEAPDETREFVRGQIEEGFEKNMPASTEAGGIMPLSIPGPLKEYVIRMLASGFLWTGVDYLNLVNILLLRRKGALMIKLSGKRTGEKLPPAPNISVYLKDPEACRLL